MLLVVRLLVTIDEFSPMSEIDGGSILYKVGPVFNSDELGLNLWPVCRL